MAPRAQWNGYLRLSLVSCPVSLYPASTPAERISFRQVNRETGNRLRQQLIDSVTGEVVDASSKGRGYEVAENQFLVVADEELRAAEQEARMRPFAREASAPDTSRLDKSPRSAKPPLKVVERDHDLKIAAPPEPPPAAAPVPRPILENNRTIELDRFVPRDEVDPRYYLAPYYLAPRDEVGLEAFSLIRDAMGRQGLFGMGRVVLANRERPIIIEPFGSGMRAFTLHYAHEIRSEEEYLARIPPMELPEDMLQVTEMILESKRGSFDTAYLEDRYRTVLVEKLREKQSQAIPRPLAQKPLAQNVVNLMDALKRSLAEQKPPAPSRSGRSADSKAAPQQLQTKPAGKATKARPKS